MVYFFEIILWYMFPYQKYNYKTYVVCIMYYAHVSPCAYVLYIYIYI